MATSQSQQVFRDCWFLFGGVNDIGYSHSMNLGRLEINRYLQDKYHRNNNNTNGTTTTTATLSTFDSVAFPNVFFMTEAERRELLQYAIQTVECHLIVSASAGLIANEYDVARQYPNISFIGAGDSTSGNTDMPPPSNFIEYQLDWLDAAFVSGAVAAGVTTTTGTNTNHTTCGGFITAFEDRVSTWSHTMGFVLGYRWATATAATAASSSSVVHVVTMNNYYQPMGEVLAAQQLVEHKGCQVIARHTDPNDVDQYISQLESSSSSSSSSQSQHDQPVLSMARYVDMSTFVGDTVFTSQVWDSFAVFVPLIEHAFERRRHTTTTTTTSSEMEEDDRRNSTGTFTLDRTTAGKGTMRLSPFTPRVNQTLARVWEQRAWEYLATHNPLCDQRWRHNGQLLNAPGEPCVTASDVRAAGTELSYLVFDDDDDDDAAVASVVYYAVPFEDGSHVCRGGKYYVYDTDTLALSCVPCPAHTFRHARDPAQAACVPCPPDTFAAPGSQQCTERTTNTGVLVGVSLTAFVVVLTTVLTAYIWHRRQRRRDNTWAPKQPHVAPIAIVFTDIQASTTIWANAPECMSHAVESHHALLRTILHKHRGYEVKTVGDSFMIAHNSITSAVAIALEIQHKLHHFDWGTTKIDDIYTELLLADPNNKRRYIAATNRNLWNGLRIRVGIAYGLCDGQIDPITGGWDYYGTTVNTAARVEAVAHGGQVVLTGPAYQALLLAQNHSQPQDPGSFDTNPIALPESLQAMGIARAATHGMVYLRGLRERIALIELSPQGFVERDFPPLRIEDAVPESADASPNHVMEEGGVNTTIDPDLPYKDSEQDNMLADLTPELRMERMMKICMRDAGVRKYDSTLLESSWSIFLSLKAMLSLHSAEEREKILSDWTKRWHLSVPVINPEILKTVGGEDIPKLLMLSARAATVVLADKQPLLDTSSTSSRSFMAGELPGSASSRSFLAFTQQSTRALSPFKQQQQQQQQHHGKKPSSLTNFFSTPAEDLEPTSEDHLDDTSFRSSTSC